VLVGAARATLLTLLVPLTSRTLLTLSALAACTPYRRDPAVELHPDGARVASQWNGALAPPAGRGGAGALTGVVTATPGLDGTSTYVHVTLAGAPPGAAYPWQLREGPCGGSGPVVGTAGAYGPLAVNDQGRATAAATVPLRLGPGARYHVRVSASAADSGTVVACGDLSPPTR
jgi:hypothetical protein